MITRKANNLQDRQFPGNRMARFLLSALFVVVVALPTSSLAGSRVAGVRVSGFPARSRTWVAPIAPGPRFYYWSPYTYPSQFYYWPSYPSFYVVSPYTGSYYAPPAVVATWPFFCVFHNEGFVSRVGLLDHLSSSLHRIPLDVAASICPDGAAACIFPSY
jgi:hypothetical protein